MILENKEPWKKVKEYPPYTIWERTEYGSNPYYQATKGELPDCDAGYYNINSLLKLKGIKL